MSAVMIWGKERGKVFSGRCLYYTVVNATDLDVHVLKVLAVLGLAHHGAHVELVGAVGLDVLQRSGAWSIRGRIGR